MNIEVFLNSILHKKIVGAVTYFLTLARNDHADDYCSQGHRRSHLLVQEHTTACRSTPGPHATSYSKVPMGSFSGAKKTEAWSWPLTSN
jgi:hypothetical protein